MPEIIKAEATRQNAEVTLPHYKPGAGRRGGARVKMDPAREIAHHIKNIMQLFVFDIFELEEEQFKLRPIFTQIFSGDPKKAEETYKEILKETENNPNKFEILRNRLSGIAKSNTPLGQEVSAFIKNLDELEKKYIKAHEIREYISEKFPTLNAKAFEDIFKPNLTTKELEEILIVIKTKPEDQQLDFFKNKLKGISSGTVDRTTLGEIAKILKSMEQINLSKTVTFQKDAEMKDSKDNKDKDVKPSEENAVNAQQTSQATNASQDNAVNAAEKPKLQK